MITKLKKCITEFDSVTKDKRLHAPKNKLPMADDIDEKRVRIRKNNELFTHLIYN